MRMLHATYSSPSNASFEHSANLPPVTSKSTSERVNYLSALQRETAALQDRVNTELTQRMEEDKAHEASDSSKKGSVNEAAEEENYGEEVPEDD